MIFHDDDMKMYMRSGWFDELYCEPSDNPIIEKNATNGSTDCA